MYVLLLKLIVEADEISAAISVSDVIVKTDKSNASTA